MGAFIALSYLITLFPLYDCGVALNISPYSTDYNSISYSTDTEAANSYENDSKYYLNAPIPAIYGDYEAYLNHFYEPNQPQAQVSTNEPQYGINDSNAAQRQEGENESQPPESANEAPYFTIDKAISQNDDNTRPEGSQLTASRTEFLTYTAPEDSFELEQAQQLASALAPQRVLLIMMPETNVYSLTAEQLRKQNLLDVYLLNRQAETTGLAEKLEEIKEKNAKDAPSVHIVNYNMPEDADKALDAIKAGINDAFSADGSVTMTQAEDLVLPVSDASSEKPENEENVEIVTSRADTDETEAETSAPSDNIGKDDNVDATELDEKYLPPK